MAGLATARAPEGSGSRPSPSPPRAVILILHAQGVGLAHVEPGDTAMLATLFDLLRRLVRALVDDLRSLEAFDDDDALAWSWLTDRVYYDENGQPTSDPSRAAF